MTRDIVDLPPRQFQIATLVAAGRTNKQVAATLGISVHTVANSLRVIFEKLQVRNRVELANALTTGAAAAKAFPDRP